MGFRDDEDMTLIVASADETSDRDEREAMIERHDEPGEMSDSEIEAIRAEVLAEEARLLREANAA